MRKVFLFVLVVAFVLSFTVVAYASGSSSTMSDMTDVLTTSFTSMISEMMLSIAAILPVVLPLLGVSMLIAFGIRWFKKIVGKAG